MSSKSVSPAILPLLAQAVADLAKTASALSEVAQSLSNSGKGNAGIAPNFQDALNTVQLASKSAQALSGTLKDHNEQGVKNGVTNASSNDEKGTADERSAASKSKSSNSVDSNTPQARLSDPPSATLAEFRDTLASFGHYYVVLDEEFDAFPLIATYTSNSPKTVCYTAVPNSTASLGVILGEIVKQREIMTPTLKQEIKQLRQTIGALNASSTPWTIFLAFKILARMELGNCLSDCIILWGLPPTKHVPDLKKAVERARHICIILTQDEYARPETQEILTSLSIAKHPNSAMFNRSEPNSLLFSARSILARVLSEPRHQGHVRKLYEIFLFHHDVGQARLNNCTPLELARRHANIFIAKVEDGQRPHALAETNRQLGPEEAVRAELIAEIGDVVPAPANVSRVSGNSSASLIGASTTRPLNPHSYIALEEDFDVIPLICYLADNHPKTICFISHQKSISFYPAILQQITSGQIILPGKKKQSIVKGFEKFVNSESGILLLPGEVGAPIALKGMMADAVVHWGLPEKGHFLGQIKFPKASKTYLIVPTNAKSAVTSQVVQDNQVQAHPESARLTAYGPKSPLLLYRRKTTTALANTDAASLKQAYLDQLIKRAPSKLEAARRANRFMAQVLLHGEPEDGSEVYKTIAPRIKLSSTEAHGRGLGPAISQGLIYLSN